MSNAQGDKYKFLKKPKALGKPRRSKSKNKSSSKKTRSVTRNK